MTSLNLIRRGNAVAAPIADDFASDRDVESCEVSYELVGCHGAPVVAVELVIAVNFPQRPLKRRPLRSAGLQHAHNFFGNLSAALAPLGAGRAGQPVQLRVLPGALHGRLGDLDRLNARRPSLRCGHSPSRLHRALQRQGSLRLARW